MSEEKPKPKEKYRTVISRKVKFSIIVKVDKERSDNLTKAQYDAFCKDIRRQINKMTIKGISQKVLDDLKLEKDDIPVRVVVNEIW